MNKKADTTTLSFVGGLILAVIIVIALYFLILILIPEAEEPDADVTTFYYKTAVNSLKETLGTETLIFLGDKNYAVVGFSKGINEISKLDDKCGMAQLANPIKKPVSCQGGACLCLCKADTEFLSFSSETIINCEAESSICEIFPQDVIADQSCTYFLYHSKDGKPKEFLATKQTNNIIIKVK